MTRRDFTLTGGAREALDEREANMTFDQFCDEQIAQIDAGLAVLSAFKMAATDYAREGNIDSDAYKILADIDGDDQQKRPGPPARRAK